MESEIKVKSGAERVLRGQSGSAPSSPGLPRQAVSVLCCCARQGGRGPVPWEESWE